jgi:hypothetical protein
MYSISLYDRSTIALQWKLTASFFFVGGNSLALQKRQPEDKGYPFPEYACHGGGESLTHPLALLASPPPPRGIG